MWEEEYEIFDALDDQDEDFDFIDDFMDGSLNSPEMSEDDLYDEED